MPSPRIPHSIQVVFDNAVAGAMVTFTNRTTGETLKRAMNAAGRVVVAAADFTSGYTNADVIQIQASGANHGFTTVTIDVTEPIQMVNVTTVANSTTNAPLVNL